MFSKMKDGTKKEKREGREVLSLPIDAIHPNPSQPRRVFEEGAIGSLAASIRRYGILQPLSVRQSGAQEGYELVAGERRLRAARLAGLSRVPCILISVNERESAELAIIENLQRRDLDLFEEAGAIATLIREYELTQDEVASGLSVSQSYVANKLRLLRFDMEQRQLILEGRLSERHARAILRLTEEARTDAIRYVRKNDLNVAATEEYVERLLTEEKEKAHPRARIRFGALRDLRLFYNSIDRVVETVRRAGLFADTKRMETEGGVDVVIRIRKTNPR